VSAQRPPKEPAAEPASGADGGSDRSVLAGRLGTTIDPDLFELALTHRSYAYENGGLPTNERLEFLGDSVLGLVVTDEIYRIHPDLPEGQLAKIRASVVNMRALAGVARELGVGDHVRLGRGEETTGGRDKASILADTVEALLGATWLTGGLGAAGPLVHRLFDPLLAAAAELGAALDWKTSVQELCSERGIGTPEYVVAESGPDHAKMFEATVLLEGVARGSGVGPSKKEAEQRAADAAWHALTEDGETDQDAEHDTGPAQDTAVEPGPPHAPGSPDQPETAD
jgi:ribonuclease-3